MSHFTRAFFDRPVDRVARELVGCELMFRGVGGAIVETESYDSDDPASHSFKMRRTPRNAAMFGPAGSAYVYRSYGIHWCLNFVCRPGSAVLIRALAPQKGVGLMRRRRKVEAERLLCSGPGRLCQALRITDAEDGASLLAPPFVLTAAKSKPQILIGPRIGLTKARDIHRRFGLAGSLFLSRAFSDSQPA